MKKKPQVVDDYNEVRLNDAKPNKMFADWLTARMRFLTFVKAVTCPTCGKRSRFMWTMTMTFKACIFGKHPVVLKDEPKVLAPLTPVCRDHPLVPVMPARWKKN